MATQTTNYGLTKPSYNETADIGVINSNMDIIDAKMKAIENKAGSGGGGGGTSDYLQLSNKPKINGIELVNNVTTEGLGIVIPQYTSELENDSGFITNETDPTVPAWAKEPTKPTYTAEEVGALPSNTPIPDPTSVVVDRFVSVGTHIADISVNGEKTELYAPTGGGGTSVTVDSELSTTSENPVQNKVITQALNGKGTYSKPTGGIPKTDLASEVQTSLGKADTALQEHQDISGKADKADLTALSNSISDAWNASTTYKVGQYCIYNNSLWKCLVQHSGQTPTEGTYWKKVSVGNEITSINNSLGTYELLLETKATNQTEYTVKDINSFRAISVMSYYTSGILGNVLIPTSIFKAMGGNFVQSGFGTPYVSLASYVSDTKISAYVGGQNASNTTCKVYGVK